MTVSECSRTAAVDWFIVWTEVCTAAATVMEKCNFRLLIFSFYLNTEE